MVYALDQLPRGRVLSRRAKAVRTECVDVPFDGWRQRCYRLIQDTPVLRRRSDLLTLLQDVNFDLQLARQAQDAILFDGVMAQCCLTFRELSKKKIPLVLTALNWHIDSLGDALVEEHKRLGISAPTFIHPRMRVRMREEVERATCVRTISDASRQSFIERGVPAARVETVLPAVDLDHFRPTAQQDDVFRVLSVSTIDARKGTYYLLQAFEKAAIPNSELVIIGATGSRWASQMLRGFTSRLSNIRIQSADVIQDPVESTYGPATIFAHPAIEDGFALAVSQALACGKPVITTRQTGASQLIVDGQHGYVLECRDVDGLVDRMRLMARDRALLGRMTAAAPSAVADLGYPALATRIGNLYRRLLGRS